MRQDVSQVERERLEQLLLSASRTFAINIPMLPGVLRDALTLGYLLLRNADTLEDAYMVSKDRRIDSLRVLGRLMADPDPWEAQRFAASFDEGFVVENPDHLQLLRLTPYLLEQLALLPVRYGQEVRAHIERIISRMQRWVAAHDDGNRLRLTRLKELDDYCYSVAGIVGELITTLVSLYRPALDRTRLLFMRTMETTCGAGLQLTNILKDVFRDHQEGRYYIPREYLPLEDGVSPRRMLPMIAYAYRHLAMGLEYALALPEEEIVIRRALLVPFLLAVATLTHLLENLEALLHGVEVKISRQEVAEILMLADEVAGRDEAARRAWRELSAPLLELDPQHLMAAKA